MLLAGVVLGVLFRSLQSLLARLISPNDFAVAQVMSYAQDVVPMDVEEQEAAYAIYAPSRVMIHGSQGFALLKVIFIGCRPYAA